MSARDGWADGRTERRTRSGGFQTMVCGSDWSRSCLCRVCLCVCPSLWRITHYSALTSLWHHSAWCQNQITVLISLSDHCSEIPLTHWPRCRTPLYAHIWRSLMSSILSPYLGMPIYGHIVSVLMKSSVVVAMRVTLANEFRPFMPIYGDPWCHHIWALLPYMEIPRVINIEPISGNAHIWTYCSHKSIWQTNYGVSLTGVTKM